MNSVISFFCGIFHFRLIVAKSSDVLFIVARKLEITEETELCVKQENVKIRNKSVLKINLFIHI